MFNIISTIRTPEALMEWMVAHPDFTSFTFNVDNHPKKRTVTGLLPDAIATFTVKPTSALKNKLMVEMTAHIKQALGYPTVHVYPTPDKGTLTFYMFKTLPVQEVPK